MNMGGYQAQISKIMRQGANTINGFLCATPMMGYIKPSAQRLVTWGLWIWARRRHQDDVSFARAMRTCKGGEKIHARHEPDLVF